MLNLRNIMESYVEKNIETNNVFVYGTLKKGFGNNDILTRYGPSDMQEGEAVGFGTMYDVGFFPAVVPDGGGNIKGEVYTFPQHRMGGVLSSLDTLEGYGGKNRMNHYDRVLTNITLSDGRELPCYIYVFDAPSKHMQKVANGDWTKKYSQSKYMFDPQEDEYFNVDSKMFAGINPDELEHILKALSDDGTNDVSEEDKIYAAVDDVFKDVIDPLGRMLRFSDFNMKTNKVQKFADNYGFDLTDEKVASIFFDELFEDEEEDEVAQEMGHDPEDLEAYAMEHGNEDGIDWSEFDDWERGRRGSWRDKAMRQLRNRTK